MAKRNGPSSSTGAAQEVSTTETDCTPDQLFRLELLEVESRIRDRDPHLLPGWAIFPALGKRPATGCRWGDVATADPGQRATLTDEFEHDGWAVHCGRSNLVVIDCDRTPEIDGIWNLWDWLDDHGDESGVPALVGATPRGGRHGYYRAPAVPLRPRAPIDGDRLRGVDLRAGVASATFAGPGRVLVGSLDLTEPPAVLVSYLELLQRPAPSPSRASVGTSAYSGHRLTALANQVAGAPSGERNSRLNWAAYAARELVGTIDEVTVTAVLIDAAVDAGLTASEATATIRSGLGVTR